MGYYGGAEDYFTHESGGHLDIHDDVGGDLRGLYTVNGSYSTHIYAERAQKILTEWGQTARSGATAKFFMYLAWQAIRASSRFTSCRMRLTCNAHHQIPQMRCQPAMRSASPRPFPTQRMGWASTAARWRA
eukprot:COSAG01_NODE_8507_length_2760_cov_1.273581_3_plen_131_part_00